MGLFLLLSLLLLLTRLQAGECPGHPGSALRPSESPGRTVAGQLERGSAGVAGQASQPQQATGWSHSASQSQPFTLLPTPSLARGTPRPESQSYHLPQHCPWGRVSEGLGLSSSSLPVASKSLLSPLLQVAQKNVILLLAMGSNNQTTSQPLRVAPSTSLSPSIIPGSWPRIPKSL